MTVLCSFDTLGTSGNGHSRWNATNEPMMVIIMVVCRSNRFKQIINNRSAPVLGGLTDQLRFRDVSSSMGGAGKSTVLYIRLLRNGFSAKIYIYFYEIGQ